MLIVSTDPAHSLRDALGRPVPARLHAVELDAPRAFARWIARNRHAASDVLEHGTWLDRDDIAALLELPIPGIDELVGLIEIARIARSPVRGRPRRPARRHPGGYDVVVVDTAPTGHTLRLLAAPHTVAVVADLLDRLQEEHRIIRARFAQRSRPEAADRLIEEVARQAREVAARLRSPSDTRFHWVTLPDAMAIAESEDALAALARDGIRVPAIIVNRVLTDEGPCPICDRRRAEEAAIIAKARRVFGKDRRLSIVPAQLTEPTGVKRLAAIATSLSGCTADAAIVRPRDVRAPRGQALSLPDGVATGVDPATLEALRSARVIFVGGKGGVGKTTVAAAIALSIARAHPDAAVLLLSTDPAHSVKDVFKGHLPTILQVLELDAAAAFAARATAFEPALDQIAGPDSRASELLTLAPPGIDELFGMLTVINARQQYDTIVVDTAPTGHALRLLETPDLVREWVQVLMRTLLKYREAVHAPALASALVDLSKDIRDLQALMRDPRATRFLVVSRAADLPVQESRRLFTRLRRLRLATPALIVNGITLAPGRCRRCRQTAADERVQLQALRRLAGRRVIIQTPLAAPSPRGIAALDRWRRSWIVE